MPVGIVCVSAAVVLGSVLGTLFGKHIPEMLKERALIFTGMACSGGAIVSISGMKSGGAVAFAIIFGGVIGEALKLEKGFSKCISNLERILTDRIVLIRKDEVYLKNRDMLITITALLCVSGTGIYGAMLEGMTGETHVLMLKTLLDFSSAIIFSCTFGYIVGVLSIPQFIVHMLFFLLAKLLLPFVTPYMLADFSACGGIIMFATGFRVAKIKDIPIGNMLPALVLIAPLSYLWNLVF